MAERFVRTEAGRHEVRARAAPLSRAARNLLLIIDASKAAGEWLTLVHGSTSADLQQLIDAGLIAVEGHATGSHAVPRPARTLEQALLAHSYTELYDLLTHEARARLGLVKGLRMVLEVEKCKGPDQIRALAVHFVDVVREVQGEAEAKAMRRLLGAAD